MKRAQLTQVSLKLKTQRFPDIQRTVYLILPSVPTGLISVSWVNHKNKLKRNPYASGRTNMVDWLRLSGQRAERRSESKRTVTMEL